MSHRLPKEIALRIIFPLLLISCQQKIEQIYPSRSTEISSEYSKAMALEIKDQVSVTVADDLELTLWASDTLVNDPIAISIDEKGRIFYTKGNRLTNSEFDIRSHSNWMTTSISFQTVEDRRNFLRETFAETNEEGQKFLKDLNQDGNLDWHDLTVEKEQVWFVEDLDQDGMADRTQLYIADFHEEISDLANGVEVYDDKVFITVGPDMWSTTDRDGDGIADLVSSLSHGYAVHIGFGAHGMSGAKIGPDGRLWWGIGDIGMNVVDQDGVRWKYPNRGVVVRSELDGSGFEVYASGVRNTHEFTFDKYGNLISVDNDGDHEGERERLVHLINGSDTGWRINWQFGKYTDPDNNSYKVWIDEKMHVPHWEGQAAYFLPPITNYVNGPTGMVYNPGTALSEKWYDHFFVAEFRGTPVNSPIHAFTLEPHGASYQLAETQEVVRGLLPTGIDFGPDGALYFGDWIDGWNTKAQGRIWKLDVSANMNDPLRTEVKELLGTDYNELSGKKLGSLLGHQDMRVRQKAQFELSTKGETGFKLLLAATTQPSNQLARIHGIWGIGQIARRENKDYANGLSSLLEDPDHEIVTQAAKILGDIRHNESAEALIPLLDHASLRVQLHTTEALGRMSYQPAFNPLLSMIEKNNDQDLWLRHAAMIALSRLGDEEALAGLITHTSKAVRVAAVVALRRMQSPQISVFLNDPDEFIVTEAARGINDDMGIEEALPELAKFLTTTSFQNEALLRRAINANLRVGKQENVDILIAFINQRTAPSEMKGEALQALSTWGKPSPLDRVDGRYLGPREKDDSYMKQQLAPTVLALLRVKEDLVQLESARAAGRLKIKESEDILTTLAKSHSNSEVRSAALTALFNFESPYLNKALAFAFNDSDQQVRSTALAILPKSSIPEEDAVSLFKQIMKTGTYPEQQVVLNALGSMKQPEAIAALGTYLDQLKAGKAKPEIRLDILEAVKLQGDEHLMESLNEYEASKPQEDHLSPYIETLAGGNRERGHDIFFQHEAAQCVRCHTIFETGGTMGPGLPDVGSRLSSKELLRAVVDPSGSFAEGYQMVTVKLESGETITGLVQSETEATLSIKIGNQEVREIDQASIMELTSIPSSMPPMGQILTKKEIRDVIAYLGYLKGY